MSQSLASSLDRISPWCVLLYDLGAFILVYIHPCCNKGTCIQVSDVNYEWSVVISSRRKRRRLRAIWRLPVLRWPSGIIASVAVKEADSSRNKIHQQKQGFPVIKTTLTPVALIKSAVLTISPQISKGNNEGVLESRQTLVTLRSGWQFLQGYCCLMALISWKLYWVTS